MSALWFTWHDTLKVCMSEFRFASNFNLVTTEKKRLLRDSKRRDLILSSRSVDLRATRLRAGFVRRWNTKRSIAMQLQTKGSSDARQTVRVRP